MSDERLRMLERRAIENPGDPEAQVAYRLAQVRAGLVEIPSESYLVLEMSLSSLRKHVESLARRAVKLGMVPLVLHEGEVRWHVDPDNGKRVRVVPVTVIGDPPTLGDWELVAQIQHRAEGAIIERAPGGAEFDERELERYRLKAQDCEHCGVKRERHDTYVCRHRETRAVVQVGSTCLQKFSGSDPRAAIYAFDATQRLQDAIQKAGELDETPDREWGAEIALFLAYVLDGANAHTAWHRAIGFERDERARTVGINRDEVAAPSADAMLRTTRLLNAAKEHLIENIRVERDGALVLSDHEHNLAVLLSEGAVGIRNVRLAASAVDWYERHLVESTPLAERVALALKANGVTGGTFNAAAGTITMSAEMLLSMVQDPTAIQALQTLAAPPAPGRAAGHVGRPGDRISLQVQVERIRGFQSRDGEERSVVVLRDRLGAKLVWFTSAGWDRRVRRGETYTLTATVARHEESRYNGEPETIIRNARLTDQAGRVA